MSERSTGEQPGDEWPPEWVEDGARLGVNPVVWATTSGGAVYLAVWRAFPDAPPFEHGLALAQAPGIDWLPLPADAVARVRALREARGGRPDLTEDRWQRLVRRMWSALTEAQRQDAHEILAELGLGAPAALEPRERDPSRGGLKREQVVAAVVEGAVPASVGSWDLPTQAATAEALDLADARRIRQVQGPRGWAGIQADARGRLAQSRAD